MPIDDLVVFGGVALVVNILMSFLISRSYGDSFFICFLQGLLIAVMIVLMLWVYYYFYHEYPPLEFAIGIIVVGYIVGSSFIKKIIRKQKEKNS